MLKPLDQEDFIWSCLKQGNTIQVTLIRDLDASTEMPLEKSHCYEIKNFKLTHASERVQLTKNLYHINLSNSSVILKIDPIRNSNFYCFPNFIDVYRGLVHPKFPIGMISILSNLI